MNGMSEQNLALVRRIYDAWDHDESAREFISDDVEYVNPSYAVEAGTRRGRRSFAAGPRHLRGLQDPRRALHRRG